MKHTTKHYHKHCFEQFELGKQHRRELHEYICELYNMPVVNGFILKQIKEMEEVYGYKLTGILMSLKYFFEIENNNAEEIGKKYSTQGIGIVFYVYDKARAYYSNLQEVINSNINREFNNTEETVYIEKPKKRQTKGIDIGAIE